MHLTVAICTKTYKSLYYAFDASTQHSSLRLSISKKQEIVEGSPGYPNPKPIINAKKD